MKGNKPMKTITNGIYPALGRSINENVSRCFLLTLLLSISPFLVQQAAAQNNLNPLQVALLKWGPNLTTAFAVGTTPKGIAFDGANIWVGNQDGNTVTKLRASDGALLGTFNVGNTPSSVAFDGVNIWVGNENGGNITKLRA